MPGYGSHLRHTATHYRVSVSKVSGEYRPTLVSQGTLRCMLQPRGASMLMDRHGQMIQADAIIFTDKVADVRPKIDADQSGNFDVLEIAGVRWVVVASENAAGKDHHLQIAVRKWV